MSTDTWSQRLSPGRLKQLAFGLMLVSAVFALMVSSLTGQDYLVALLPYAPGGVAEMSLIALAIDPNPGFVAIHHVARIIFVLLTVPVLTAWVGRIRARQV